ncbi:MAG: hypothetical protein IPJ19_00080 [Planctomycetes bacterium]|nr:hypothetical protein [Planctomycetota bacterium]
MDIRFLATLMVAGTTCSIASADVTTAVNPKTQQVPYQARKIQAQRENEARMLAMKQAAVQQQLSSMSQGGMQQGNPTGMPSTLALGGGDSCATPDVISGNGTFAFDNSLATTGAEGQTEALCNFFATTGVTNDVWFRWTAPSTGNALMSLCGGASMDSKIAAYAGSSCPTAGTALACNDDTCALQSQISFSVTGGSSYMLQLGNYPTALGSSGTFTMNVSVPMGNDDCSAAVVITGTGTYPFDSTLATTGPQQSLGCGGATAYNDVWFSWTAPTTGIAVYSLCNGGVGFDSLIAAYAASGCPIAGTAIGCNDDSCGLVSSMSFPVTAGTNYMLQLGGYSAAALGIGSFDLSILPPPGPCTPLDDGSTDNLLGWTAGGDLVWLNRFGQVGVPSTIGSIDVAWGSLAFPALGPGNGTATDVFLYQDGVSQDGDPSDATLVLSIPTTISAVDTDTFVTYPIAPVTITGIFFVGSHAAHLAGQYVAPMDQTAHPYGPVSYFFGDNTSPTANYANPGANVQPPATFDSIGLPAQVLARVGCSTAPATYLCDPGVSGVISCPCTNPPTGSLRGCNNSSATGGASITAAGGHTLATPTLVFTTAGEKPTATSIFLQGNAVLNAGVAFGQGVRCVGGTLKRLYTKTASGGSATAPNFGAGDPSIPARSAALGDTILAGQTRWYLTYYRDPIVLGGCVGTSTYNATNTAAVVWQ